MVNLGGATENDRKKIVITKDSKAFFHNNVDYCVGTGRMGLALTEEYQEELRLVQKEIGFKHIRGHGLFCDDMAIFQTYEEDGKVRVEYNYTYLDRVMDAYKKVGLRPFLELGFMPKKLASGSQTIFYWQGNTTPPKDYDMWCNMVHSLLRHLMGRYGEEEVIQWPIEVWNEPNLCGFWENADMQEYFKLFHRTFDAIKEVNPGFSVGGPAVCGGTDEKWIQAFMEYCHENHIPVDFVTRHHYTIDPPEGIGHYAYSELMKAEDGFANLKTTRDIIDSFPEYKGLQIHITEFNSSYTPQGVIHDTNLNAAFIAQQLSRLGDVNESYSYWTFGDVFEELGVPFTHGTHCTCGKDDGIITCLASTYYFPVSVSNIGCYGLTAALGCLTKREDILHTAEKERALIKIGVEEVMLDGGYGINHEYIDGIPADTVCAVVEVLRCLAVICHDNSNRGF